MNMEPQEQMPWFVMIHLSPKLIETMLQMDCDGKLRRDDEVPQQPYRFYVPFQYMPLRHIHRSEEEQMTDKRYRPQDDLEALRSDFHNFVFIQAPAERVQEIVKSDWNQKARLKLRYYLDAERRMVTVPDAEMQQLIATIQDRHLQFYIDQPLNDFAPGDRVVLQMEPWVGKHGEVTKMVVRHGQLSMTVSMNILGRSKSINFTDVRVGDIVFEDEECGRMLVNNPITNYEEEIIDLMSHRFGHRIMDDVEESDRGRLQRLSSYDHIYVEDKDEHARFVALKLICAYLLQAEKKRERYQQEVIHLLEGKDEPLTDMDAYLTMALFVTTRQVAFRTAFKDYRNAHPDSLPVLRRFYSIIKDVKAKNPRKSKKNRRKPNS